MQPPDDQWLSQLDHLVETELNSLLTPLEPLSHPIDPLTSLDSGILSSQLDPMTFHPLPDASHQLQPLDHHPSEQLNAFHHGLQVFHDDYQSSNGLDTGLSQAHPSPDPMQASHQLDPHLHSFDASPLGSAGLDTSGFNPMPQFHSNPLVMNSDENFHPHIGISSTGMVYRHNRDDSETWVGHVENQIFYDTHNCQIGYLSKNWKIYDSHDECVGYVDSNCNVHRPDGTIIHHSDTALGGAGWMLCVGMGGRT